MTRFITLLLFFKSVLLLAQEYQLSGNIFDQDQPVSFATVLVYETADSPVAGTSSEEDGSFFIKNLKPGKYRVSFSYIGYETKEIPIEIEEDLHLENIKLVPASESLDETVITAPLPTVRKTSGKITFHVENSVFSEGNTLDLLRKTPGVIVIGKSIQVKFSTPVVYLNGRRIYLSEAETVALLENTDAALIKSIEVITSPSAKYDAEAGTVLNIITSRAVSIGYKGSVNGMYEQGVFPKYRLGTSHFYKRDRFSVFLGYSYGIRKEFKEDKNTMRFFDPDLNPESIWKTDFDRTTHSNNHQANLVLDWDLNEKNSVNFTSTLSLDPKTTYQNNGHTSIFDPSMVPDSTITTFSNVKFKKENPALAINYRHRLNDGRGSISASGNYLYYNHRQEQELTSDYYLASGDFIRNTGFDMDSGQKNSIATGQTDYSGKFLDGLLESGVKYSYIRTRSRLNFYDTAPGGPGFNPDLSDHFNYRETIFALYVNFEKEWKNWSFSSGIRGEQTGIRGISHSEGEVNSQDYFDLFPNASISWQVNENNSLALAYGRSVSRPKYESLNPFRYYITENNYISGNPDLLRSLESNLTLSYDFRNKLFLEIYYHHDKNSLASLSFQDNENNLLYYINSNMTRSYQYAFDITYYNQFTSWWWFYLSTSSFYLAREFQNPETAGRVFLNDTYGQYIRVQNNFWLTKDRSLTASVFGQYISHYVFGNRYLKNQGFVNLSVQKKFMNNRASLTLAVDDVFNSLNRVASVSRYSDQDNFFYARSEHRIFRIQLRYDFGNFSLRDNQKQIRTDEGDRL